MKLFSQRVGLTPVKTSFQKESMDDDLRNGLWNVFYGTYNDLPHMAQADLVKMFWLYYHKQPIDELPDQRNELAHVFREPFFKGSWYQVYDFLEFVAQFEPFKQITTDWRITDKRVIDRLINIRKITDRAITEYIYQCNKVLEVEVSAYRFVGNQIAEITSQAEIDSIEQALEVSPDNVQKHLAHALKLFSDKENPDYRNSTKESISAVEALCKRITGKPKATLGQALSEIEKQQALNLHPALKRSFESLYGYASDAGGIRHAMADEPESALSVEDARYMLISCSSFINYLTVKADKAGIKLQLSNE